MVRRNPLPTAQPVQPPTVPDTSEPRFRDLDVREARFVIEYTARSGEPGTGADAALAAGYSNGNRDAAHSMASRLLRRPSVLRAIKEEAGRRMTAAAILGIATLESLARSAQSEQVRFSAASELIDRGFGPVVSKNANLNVQTSVEDLLSVLDSREQDSDCGTQVINQKALP